MNIFAPIKAFLARKEYEAEQFGLAGRYLRESSNIVVDNEVGWTASLSNLENKQLEESDQDTLRQQAIEFYYRRPHARAIIHTFCKFVVGRNTPIIANDENLAVQEWWDAYARRDKFVLRQKEFVRRAFRDGEVFLRRFINTSTGEVSTRFIDPNRIEDPTKQVSHGIETLPDDVEKMQSATRL